LVQPCQLFFVHWLGRFLIPLFKLTPSSRRLRLLLKSGGPPPFALSLNVQGDAAHDNSRFIKP